MARSIHSGNGGRASITKIVIAVMLCVSMSGGNFAYADILRGGAGRGNSPAGRTSEGRTTTPGAETAAAARLRAQDRLARTTQAISAMRAVQSSAQSRSSASVRAAGPVPDGLRPGGLQLAVGANARLSGALAPEANGRTVTIRQTEAQAVLHWETFNVSKRTTVYFDQKNGGVDSAKWIAFNKIIDPSGKPSQILGSIRADGQVYILNPNGIIFGPGSQVNARSLVASALPINDNLVERGLLSQAAGNPEFLFSTTQQGSFIPPAAFTKSGDPGNVVVDVGARLSSPVSADGNGGRIILAGANVENRGVISTPAGQTILAAGRQVGFEAHPSSDPSLRGLDVFIGEVGKQEGTVRNEGLIEIPTGSLTMAGKRVEQLGAVESSTTVSLNGRVDLLASYDAVPNSEYDPRSLGEVAPFLNRQTGTVVLGENSVTRILPDVFSDATTVGTSLPIRSRINIEGLSIYLAKNAMVQAPNAEITARAGLWVPPQTVTDSNGNTAFRRSPPNFVFTNGQIYVDSGAFVDASGTPDVFVPQSHSILTVQLRGNELAVSPVQRDSSIRGTDLVIDIRNVGNYNGRYWIGTPIGDATGFTNIIERNAAQLSAAGGSITLQAGQAIVTRENTQLDVSGGYFRNEGGVINTSVLRIGANLVDIKDATPDRVYDGLYTATSTVTRPKWGISETFRLPIAPSNRRVESEYLSGASGGTLTITAPSIALDGQVLGHTVIGREQARSISGLTNLPQASTLALNFFGQLDSPTSFTIYPTVSATPPTIQFGGRATQDSVREFAEDSVLAQPNESARLLAVRNLGLGPTSPLRQPVGPVEVRGELEPPPQPTIQPERRAKLVFADDFFQDSGFGAVRIDNSEGDFIIPAESNILLPLQGELTVAARNVTIEGRVRAPGGLLSFTGHNYSKYQAQILQTDSNSLSPRINPSLGTIRVGRNAVLDVSGLILDDRIAPLQPLVLDGGSVSLTGYNIDLNPGSLIDASGGAALSQRLDFTYGNGGAIRILAGQDPFLRSITNGSLRLDGTLQAFSGAAGGTLAIRASMVQIGGANELDGRGLVLDPEFFSQGGFQNFELTGVGLVPKKLPKLEPGEVASYIPSVYVAPGTVLEPKVVGLLGVAGADGSIRLERQVLRDGLRRPVSISLNAPGVRRDFVDPTQFALIGDILLRGDIVIGDGARIQTEPGGSIRVRGETVSLFGALRAPGGLVEVVGAGSFPLSSADRLAATYGRPTVHLGPNARLTAEGALVREFDKFGRRTGLLYNGGRIRVAGNIVAELGSSMNVSGASAEFDLTAGELGLPLSDNLARVSGLTRSPAGLRTFTTRLDSNGGTIQLEGSEMLFSDATLSGAAGGPTAVGGTLEVSSGRFYRQDQGRTSADINLVVSQQGRTFARTNQRIVSRDADGNRVITQRNWGVGIPVVDLMGEIIPGMGFFAVDRFAAGGFDSLDLGYNYNADASPVPIGGNVEFRGPVSINARGYLRIAGGGIIKADNRVELNADYVAIGQPFPDPQNPSDERFLFEQSPVPGGQNTPRFNPVATYGEGVIDIQAKHIDVGTVVMQGIGRANLSARNGDIRGSGSFNIAGTVKLDAAQIYPTTLAPFEIIAFDHEKGKGSVVITQTGSARLPLSAGGSLRIFASSISQGGNLVAPFGEIRIGWDGSDFDPIDTDFDRPESLAVGNALQIPVARTVTIQRGSNTSVSGIDPQTGRAIGVPFGISPDGVSWIDPSGVNVTASGLPVKQIALAGDSLQIEAGSRIDIRGGGELLASRWIPGNGGPVDLLGAPGAEWSETATYDPGTLVTYRGSTWSARVPVTGGTGNTPPEVSRSWTLVPEAFAVVPDFGAALAPFAPFNRGSNASALGGDPGYLSNRLRIGDQIALSGSATLPAGSYTLLPARYALLPGAVLVSPQTSRFTGTYTNADGSEIVSGYRLNAFNRSNASPLNRSTFEVASAPVFAARAEYQVVSADGFADTAAARLNLDVLQRLPRDAGHLALHGNTELSIEGLIRTWRPPAGRGASIDISSLSDIVISETQAPSDGVVTLSPSRLAGFGAESLLVGGQRRFTPDGIYINVTTPNLTLDNPGRALQGPDITLVARQTLRLMPGASIRSTGWISQGADTFIVNSPGAMVRVSADPGALAVRSEPFADLTPMLDVGDGVSLRGGSVLMDSSARFNLAATATILGTSVTLRSSEIQLAFDPNFVHSNSDAGRLLISGGALESIGSARSLTLGAYRGPIDFIGAGNLGSRQMERFSLSSSAIRAIGADSGANQLTAGVISLSNTFNAPAPTATSESQRSLDVNARQIWIGKNASRIENFGEVRFAAGEGIVLDGVGSLLVENNLLITSPAIVPTSGATQEIRANGSLVVEPGSNRIGVEPGVGGSITLGGGDLRVGTSILAPSGDISLIATRGNLILTGLLDVSGTQQSFYDLARFTDAGNVRLTSDAGDVELGAASVIRVGGGISGGHAGSLSVRAPNGRLIAGGTLLGDAAPGQRSGSFSADLRMLDSFSELADILNTGGFTEAREFRIREGDVFIDGVSRSRTFALAADAGSIIVRGTIDASGEQGGDIALVASRNLVLESGSLLTVAAQQFDSAGKGGAVRLEAGGQANGVVDLAARLSLMAGATIDLSVASYVEGDYLTEGSSAFQGQFTGTLHLRAPRNAANNDFGVDAIDALIITPSSIIAEGYALYDLTGTNGVITGWRTNFNALPQNGTLQRTIYNQAASYLSTANHDAMLARILGSDSQGLNERFVLAPGVEIVNRTGDLRIGSANSTAIGSASANSADWNLSDFRFGPRAAAGVLTMKAAGNIELLNALSDGFRGDTGVVENPVTLPFGTQPGQALWLSPLMRLNSQLPVNAQSWSFRLTAGADSTSSDFQQTVDVSQLADSSGSILLGKPYPAQIPGVSGASASTATALNNRYQVIRTGTGSIDIQASRDVQLRNQFATIYTGGVRIPIPTSVYATGDFAVPLVMRSINPSQPELGAVQQSFAPQWSIAGGDIRVSAGRDIGRFTQDTSGAWIVDSSRQIPTNWLYRRSYVDPETGLFGVGGVDSGPATVTDPSASTAWWVDFSNFFQGFGALGGGNLALLAGNDIINADAVIPTTARMPGLAADGSLLAPDPSRIRELGGGDLLIRAGRNIDGGIFYVERGYGQLIAGGSVTTNAARSPSLGSLGSSQLPASADGIIQSRSPEVFDPLTWLPTTLFVGRGGFSVTARNDVLLGPIVNAFLLPQGLNNRFWYKTYFNTYGSDASVDVRSFGGSITHRLAITVPLETNARSILGVWLQRQNLFQVAGASGRASNFQPWIRLVETQVTPFETAVTVAPPTSRSTAFSGDINIVGSLNLAPSSEGTLELASSRAINGLLPTGKTIVSGIEGNLVAYGSARVNVSDANPLLLPGIANPISYQARPGVGRNSLLLRQTALDTLEAFDRFFAETGSFTGAAAGLDSKRALHAETPLHQQAAQPIRVYANNGDISGITLFTPKFAQIVASRDITDIAFYIQNANAESISIVSAGRDIVPYNASSPARVIASDVGRGNIIVDATAATILFDAQGNPATSNVLAGDIQINGSGTLEVLAGRTIDLGTGPNFLDGTGVGITSIGRLRNPFLPNVGSNLIVLSGVTGADSDAALGLSRSSLDFTNLIETTSSADGVSPETIRIAGLNRLFSILRESALDTNAQYSAGYEAIAGLLAETKPSGDILTRSRDIRTASNGAITMMALGGEVSMAPSILGTPLVPPGIVTEAGGEISVLMEQSLNIGLARIFTLRGGDLTIWSSTGDIAAGSAPKTVVTAPPTRVTLDFTSAALETDLGGLATGGGIGVLASVSGVEPGNVSLIAPRGTVDAGDAGIRATGDITIAAVTVLNADNISAAGTSTGVPSAPVAAVPNVSGLSAGANSSAAALSTATEFADQSQPTASALDEVPSVITVEVLGYGGGEGE